MRPYSALAYPESDRINRVAEQANESNDDALLDRSLLFYVIFTFYNNNLLGKFKSFKIFSLSKYRNLVNFNILNTA